ncbi:MAG TPA: CbiQ family ECF transporter T component [Anaerolineae bacterium]|nr:CbiQ family ECF transporter T component [Anaerolineae bacterium]
MDISFIDNLAYNKDSVMHRASALSKVLMVALIISAVVISADILVFLTALVLLIAILLISNLPVLRVLVFAGYALVFSLIFAISSVGGGLLSPVIIVLKAVTAAISLLLLITTTPYPQIFGLFQRVLPQVLVDAMLVTYRSFFILIGQMSSLITAIRVRGGYSPVKIARNLSTMGRIVGHGFIHAWELSESMQNAMFVRGYKGGLPVSPMAQIASRYDLLPIFTGASILILAVIR